MLNAELKNVEPFLVDAEPSSFVRLEQKYLLPKALWTELESLLNKYSAPNYLDPDTQFTLIESIYFDSPDLRIYTDHFSQKSERYKIRARRYGPNGVFKKKSSFIEIKKKTDGICFKDRLKIPADQMVRLKRGEPILPSDNVIQKNKKVELGVLYERLKNVNMMVQDWKLEPASRVSYQRYAFEKNGFRVTIDDNLTFECLASVGENVSKLVKGEKFWNDSLFMKDLYDPGHILIMELKYLGEIPVWMTDFLAKHNVGRVRFSKYIYSMTKTLLKD